MQVIILAGGKGTRLAEESVLRPKPMVEIGGRPMLWHIMNMYAAHGQKNFLVACGYKSEIIKQYFHTFFMRNSDYVIDLKSNRIRVLNGGKLDWKVGVIDTGLETMTGGRVLRMRRWIGEERFMVTYGDGLGDIDIAELMRFHRSHGRLATLTAVRPPARFGALVIQGDRVREFSEKPQIGEGWINGGFFVFEPEVFSYLEGDETVLEREPLERLASENQLMAYQHKGFWQPMDTLREKLLLETLWTEGRAPWVMTPAQQKVMVAGVADS
jgi:glucose-1-phosphate cytidylyltransferase